MKHSDQAKAVSEHNHQVSLMKWAKLQQKKHPELKWLYAIPNGGQRNVIVATKLKAEGVKKGVSDLCLPVARRGYHGLYIEMKKMGGRATDHQKEFIGFVVMEGYCGVFCQGWESAKEKIEWYLS